MKEIDTFLIRIKKNMQICSNYLKSNSIVDLIRIGLNTFSENMEIIRQLKQPDMKLEDFKNIGEIYYDIKNNIPNIFEDINDPIYTYNYFLKI